jgi:flagellar FliL protein
MATQDKETPAAPKKGRKLIFILAALTVLGAAGGGGAWYFTRPLDPHAASAVDKPALFLPLENFTVNLLPQEGQPQDLQAGLTLKLGAGVKSEVIKDRMPEIRNRILMVLSGKKAADLLSTKGKQKLAIEIADATKEVIAPAGATKVAARPAPAVAAEPVDAAAAEGGIVPPAAAAPVRAAALPVGPEIDVLFTSFIIQ